MSRQISNLDIAMQRLVRISLMIYPLVAHIAIMLDQAILAAGYLLVAVYLNSLKFLSQYKYIGRAVAALLLVILVYFFINFQDEYWPIYLPPVLTPAWLAFVFIGSLSHEQAFISVMAERIEGKPLDQKHLLYTRRLTIIWGAVFILMICEAVFLALWAPFEVWSWWVHIGNYIIVAFLFIGEFFTRHLFIGKPVQILKMFKELIQQNGHESRNK